MRARYLVGCDGGRSAVRKAIGAKLDGTPVIQRVQSTYIRAPALLALIRRKPAWAYYSLNPRRCGNVYRHRRPRDLAGPQLPEAGRDRTSTRSTATGRSAQILGVGADFEYEVISKEDWIGRRLVADRFRDRRVFICGDAAHLWVPYAGYGMNAGIADAANLSGCWPRV